MIFTTINLCLAVLTMYVAQKKYKISFGIAFLLGITVFSILQAIWLIVAYNVLNNAVLNMNQAEADRLVNENCELRKKEYQPLSPDKDFDKVIIANNERLLAKANYTPNYETCKAIKNA